MLGQVELPVSELLAPGARTLTNLGEVASLDLTVAVGEGRPILEYEVQVDPRRTLDDLVAGKDAHWEPLPVWNGDVITIRARGQICPSSASECFGPEGAAGRWQSYNYEGFEEAAHGSLVAILPGQAEVVGARAEFVARESGWLLLFANDRDTGNNDGGFDVLVTVTPAGLQR